MRTVSGALFGSVLLLLACAAHGFVAVPSAALRVPLTRATAAAPLPLQQLPVAARPTQLRLAATPTMGLFGLGTPELAVIAAVGLLILGPEQVKKMAKEVGKVSAELKQVPEEFNKGMAKGVEELEQKKAEMPAASDAESPPTPPPAA